VDFITDLLLSKDYTNIMIITDRLGKGVIFKPLYTITALDITQVFLRIFYRHYRLLAAIVSDRGLQFVRAI
jgi:hypothetical protein